MFKKLICLFLAGAMLFAVVGCKDSKTVISDDSFYDDYYDGETVSDDMNDNNTSGNNASGNNTSGNNTSGNNVSSKGNSSRHKSPANNGNVNGDDHDITQNVKDKNKFKGKIVKMLVSWDIKNNSFEMNAIKNLKKDLGITIKPVVTTIELYQTKLTSMIASKDSPDICYMDSSGFPTMILKNKIVPIDTNIIDIKKDIELTIPVMDLFKWNGKYYGIACPGSWQGGPYVLLYNKTAIVQKGYKTPLELYRKGDWNWDTFAELAKNMTDKSKGFYGFGCDDTVQQAFLASIKTDFVKFEGKTIKNNLDDPKLTKALTFLSELRKNGYTNPEINGGKSTSRAMTVYSTWILQKKHWKTALGTEATECVPIPSPKGQEAVTAFDAKVFCIARGAKNPEAALYAARYFIDPDNYDMTTEIESKQMREMFYELGKSKNVFGGLGRGVASYNAEEDYWKLLYLTRESAENIPVRLKEQKTLIDGAISKIESDSKLFN